MRCQEGPWNQRDTGIRENLPTKQQGSLLRKQPVTFPGEAPSNPPTWGERAQKRETFWAQGRQERPAGARGPREKVSGQSCKASQSQRHSIWAIQGQGGRRRQTAPPGSVTAHLPKARAPHRGACLAPFLSPTAGICPGTGSFGESESALCSLVCEGSGGGVGETSTSELFPRHGEGGHHPPIPAQRG